VAKVKVTKGDPNATDENKRHPYCVIDCIVTGEHEQSLGRHLFVMCPLQKGKAYHIRNIIKAAEIEVDPDSPFDTDIIVGAEFLGVITVAEGKGIYAGSKRNQLGKTMPLSMLDQVTDGSE
jgi:hypothetical protein